MASTTEADVKALQEQLQQLRTDLAAIGEAAKRATAPDEKVWAEVKRRAETASREIEEKPLVWAFASFGVGFLFGVLFYGRRG